MTKSQTLDIRIREVTKDLNALSARKRLTKARR